MREFIFSVVYDPGSDPVMDVFIDYPDLLARSLACCVTELSMWRVDRFSGPQDALAALDRTLFESTRCEECIGHENCHSECHYELLAEGRTTRTVYSHRPEITGCHSIPYLATTHLGDGVVFDTTRRDDQYRWRLLTRDDAPVGTLYDALRTTLRDGLGLDLRHLRAPAHWGEEVITLADLPFEQREALEAAVEGGYYETPRAVTTADLARNLSIPRSTLQYRLQRAEAWLTTRFVGSVP